MKIVFTLLLICVGAAAAIGQPNAAKEHFTDTVLVDQDGKSRRFFTDLMDGKVVIINSFHSDCPSTGPPMTAALRKIRENLSARASEFNIISISVDPADDAAKAKAYADRYKTGPGWYFLTGEKSNMETVLRKLGMYVANKDEHSSILIVGNLRTGLWKKVFGLASLADVQAQIESVLNDAPPPKRAKQ